MATQQKIKYVYSDPHFDSQKIISLTKRPFSSVEEMNAVLIENYNAVIQDRDAVCYWLGDVMYSATKEKVSKLLGKMNGRKYLILGNHDRNHTETWWRDCGFEKVFTYPQYHPETKIFLSHEPLEEFNLDKLGSDIVNVHGHIHNNGYDFKNHKNYINVSVEETGYKPVVLQNSRLTQENDKTTYQNCLFLRCFQRVLGK